MKAAVWTALGTIEVQEVDIPTPQYGWVRLKVTRAGLCATDLHIIDGQLEHATAPAILGHEICGIVDQLGDGVNQEQIQIGQRVVVETAVGCGRCDYCRTGNMHLCAEGGEIGYTPYPGGYAQYVCVPTHCLRLLPDTVDDDSAAIMEAVACPFGSFYRHPICYADDVLIFGTGVAGLSYILAAKAHNARRIIVVGSNKERLARCKEFGATHVIHREQDVATTVQEICGGATIAVDALGAEHSLHLAIASTAPMGRILLYGIPDKKDMITFPMQETVLKQLTLHGVTNNELVWEPLLQQMASGQVDLRPMVTHHYTLDEVHQAFEDMRKKPKDFIKGVVHPWATERSQI